MKRLVTDDPQDNVEVMMNLAFVKDKEVWIRCGSETGEDCSIPLVKYQNELCKRCELCKDVELDTENLDAIGDYYMDCSMDGCPIGTAYFIAIQAAELRERLRKFENDSEPDPKPAVIDNGKAFCPHCMSNIRLDMVSAYCAYCGKPVIWDG